MARVTIYPRDYVLFVALFGMCLLVILNWSQYKGCEDPLNVWLIVDFMSFIIFRALQFVFQYFATSPRPVRIIPRLIAFINLWIVYPFMWAWCILGTIWYTRSSSCLPEATQNWWFIAWLIYSYIYIVMFGFLIFSTFRMRRDQRLHTLEQVQRFLAEYQQAQAYGLAPERVGLTQEQIDAIPLKASPRIDTCSICLNEVAVQTPVRDLGCTHVFHKECLDQWLLIRDTCPNCVQRIAQSSDALLQERHSVGFVV